MGTFMSDNILRPKFNIVSKNEPHEIIDYYFEQIEEALSYYDLEEDVEIAECYQYLQTSVLWWQLAWKDHY